MNRTILIVSFVIALGFAAFGSSAVYAQTPEPEQTQEQQGAPRFGGGFRRGFEAGQRSNMMAGRGILREAMREAIAEALGLPVEQIKARLESGERLSSILSEAGFSFEEFRELMADARAKVIEKALADGLITGEQAEWQSQRAGGMRRNAAEGPGSGCPNWVPAQP